jgi:serine/threonine-protein kinase RsbW
MPPSLTIPSATEHLVDVRRFVGERAAAAGLRERAVDEVRLAVDEACANAIEHAYAGRADGTVTVEIRHGRGRLRVVVRHTGLPFDPARYRAITLEDAVHRRRRGGFGVSLMNRLVDRVEYRREGPVSEVHLIKLLNGTGSRPAA